MLISFQIVFSLLVLVPTTYWLYQHSHPVKQYKHELLFILVLACITATTYFTRLSEITTGAYGDEITIGLAAQDIVKQPGFVPFTTVNLGHPTLLLYLTGYIFQALGTSLVTLRLSSLSYPMIILSRLAYEMTAALFFFVSALLRLQLASFIARIQYGGGSLQVVVY